MTIGHVRVSVIIPAFNGQSYIRKSTQSALAQTERRLEVIVVDDCSVDQTARVVQELAEKDARVRLISLDRNSGHGHAQNVGIAAARGDWIALLDQDDWYGPSRLGALLRLAESNDAEIAADNQYWVFEQSRRVWRLLFPALNPPPRLLTAAEFLRRDAVASWVNLGYLKPVIRRDFLTSTRIVYDESLRIGQDSIFLATCLLRGAHLVLGDTPHYYYLTRSASQSNTTTERDLRTMQEANDRLIDLAPTESGAEIESLLGRRSKFIDRAIRHRQIMDEARRGRLLSAAKRVIQDPAIIPFSVDSLCRGALRRLLMSLSYLKRRLPPAQAH